MSVSDFEQCDSALIIKPSSMGDVLHTLPFLQALKARRPEWKLRWVINPEWAPLLQGHEALEELIVFPRGEFRGLSGWWKARRWYQELGQGKETRKECVFDLQGLARSGLMAKARGGWKVGRSDAREGARFVYDEVVEVPGRAHAVEKCMALLGVLEEVEVLEKSRGEKLAVPSAKLPLQDQALEAMEAHAGKVVVHPFARGRGKSLPREEVKVLLEALQARGLEVVLAGQVEEEESSWWEAQSGVCSLLNKTTLPELVALMARSAGVLSVDSGPMHVAAALEVPLLALHSWSDPFLVGPWSEQAMVWRQGTLASREDFAGGVERSGRGEVEMRLSSEEAERVVEDLVGLLGKNS